MSEPTDTFDALLKKARQGDPSALAQLIQQYEPRVRLVARVLLGPALRPHFDSLDLVQSVHRSLLVGLRQEKFAITSPENLIALAVTVVRRKVARHWQRAQRQQRLSGRSVATENLAHALTALSSPHEDPAQAAQFNDQVRHLCADLDPSERRLLHLRLEGYSTAEMAADLGISPIALRVRLTRLRQRLQTSGIFTEWL